MKTLHGKTITTKLEKALQLSHDVIEQLREDGIDESCVALSFLNRFGEFKTEPLILSLTKERKDEIKRFTTEQQYAKIWKQFQTNRHDSFRKIQFELLNNGSGNRNWV